jgi:hypothetical protein
MPSFLLPRKGRYGLGDYEKMFCADLRTGNDIFAVRGIDRERGRMVIVRRTNTSRILSRSTPQAARRILRWIHVRRCILRSALDDDEVHRIAHDAVMHDLQWA